MPRRDKLQRAVNKEFKAWVKEVEKELDYQCHDKITENDVIDRELILRYVNREIIWEFNEIYKDKFKMEFLLFLIFSQMGASGMVYKEFQTKLWNFFTKERRM